jgi:hypothetical protein
MKPSQFCGYDENKENSFGNNLIFDCNLGSIFLNRKSS